MKKKPYWDNVEAVSKFNLRKRELENRDGHNIINTFKQFIEKYENKKILIKDNN